MGMWSLGLGAVGAAIVGIFFVNTDLCLPKVGRASMDFLEDADLRSTTEGEKHFYNVTSKNRTLVYEQSPRFSNVARLHRLQMLGKRYCMWPLRQTCSHVMKSQGLCMEMSPLETCDTIRTKHIPDLNRCDCKHVFFFFLSVVNSCTFSAHFNPLGMFTSR